MNSLLSKNILLDNEYWLQIVNKLDFAFQPIIDTKNGTTFGVEALLRGLGNTGFPSIDIFFNIAFEEEILFPVDIALRKKAIKKFKTIPFHDQIKLFYNYDPRIQIMDNYQFGKTEEILHEHGLNTDTICLELSEKYPFDFSILKKMLHHFKKRGINIVIDDFGAGFSGLELFYNSNPDIIKFDRFLISNINSDHKKRNFCFNLLNLTYMEGVKATAEGIESEEEFITCRNLGFDFIQGYFIQEPKTDTSKIQYTYNHINNFNSKKKYNTQTPLPLK